MEYQSLVKIAKYQNTVVCNDSKATQPWTTVFCQGMPYVVKVLHCVLEIFHYENPGKNQERTQKSPKRDGVLVNIHQAKVIDHK